MGKTSKEYAEAVQSKCNVLESYSQTEVRILRMMLGTLPKVLQEETGADKER
jgi:hypothetical protein